MKDIKFERELKLLLYYIREYGIQHSTLTKRDKPGSNAHNNFVANVHKGYMLAQENVVGNLTKVLTEKKQVKKKLKEANRARNKGSQEECRLLLKKLKIQETSFRKIMDSIAWTLLGFEITDVRKLYGGEEPIDITNSNIESCINYSEHIFSNNPLEFALINDLTSFVQTGDILQYKYGESLSVIELKEGIVNEKVFDVLDYFQKSKCDKYLYMTLEEEGNKFKEQLIRNIKQIATGTAVVDTLKTGQGTDRFTGLKVNTEQEQLELATFTDVTSELIKKARSKGYAIIVVENCLSVGVYYNDKFPKRIFSKWMKASKNRTPIYDLRQSLIDPVSYPLFLQPFPKNTIVDIVLGRISILMSIDINTWLAPLEKEGYIVKWLSEKETRRLYGNLKGQAKLLSINGRAIAVEKDDFSIALQGGLFARMFTSFNTPSAMRKYIIEINKKAIKKKENSFDK